MIFTAPVLLDNFRAQAGAVPNDQTPLSKTEDFKFEEYLLGLQVDGLISEDEQRFEALMASTHPEGMVVEPEGEAKEEALLTLFDKGSGQNTLLAPVAFQPVTVSSQQLSQTAQREGVDSGISSAWRNPQEVIQTWSGKEVSDTATSVEPDEVAEADFLSKLYKQTTENVGQTYRETAIQKYGGSTLAQALRSVSEQQSEDVKSDPNLPAFGRAQAEKSLFSKDSAKQGSMERTEMLAPFTLSTGASQAANVSAVAVGPTTETVTQSSSVSEVVDKVESMAYRGGGKMTVSLNPPDLGRLAIEVTTKGKKVTVEIMSENNLAKSILESRLHDLKVSMQTQDLNLSKLEVNVMRNVDSMSDQSMGNQFSQADDSRFHHEPSNQSGQSNDTLWSNNQSSEPIRQNGSVRGGLPSNPLTKATGSHGVDIRI